MTNDFSRRGFLGGAIFMGAAAVGWGQTPMPPEEPELDKQPKEPGKKIGVAIVGLGKLAIEQILPAFAKSEKCRVAGLVTGHPGDKGKVIAEKYGVDAGAIYTYETYEKMKENAGIDAVYIVLPNGMHAEFTERAAAVGKHVLCEKPMATSAADCRKMIEACKGAGKKLMIAYRIQYEPHNLKARELMKSGNYGTIRAMLAANTQNQKGGTWRTNKKLAGGGALPDIGLYCLNTTRFLLGEEPVEVRAFTYSTPGDERFKEVEESVQFTLEFGSGVLLDAYTSYGVNGSKGYRALGEKGMVEMDPAFPYKGLRLYARGGAAGENERKEIVIEDADQFALELDHFGDAVMGDKAVRTPGEEGLKDQVLMEAIYQAAASGGPVKVG